MEPSLTKGESLSFLNVIQEVRGCGYSDIAVQFFFICILHISFHVVLREPLPLLGKRKATPASKGRKQSDYFFQVVCLLENY